GQDASKPILLGFNGHVYDVTTGKGFYGPGGAYSLFAGHDCTRSLALGSLDPNDLPGETDPFQTTSTVDAELVAGIESWEKRLKAKYPVVGQLVNV
ncbi:cytochrome b5, partial [Linderina pennispora]